MMVGFTLRTWCLKALMLGALIAPVGTVKVSQAANLPPPDFKNLSDTIIQPIFKQAEVKSSIVAFSWHGRRRYYPYSNGVIILNKNPRVEIGSITKVYTSALLGEALSLGEINATASIGTYLPGNSLKSCTAQINAVELADFSSGLPRLPVAPTNRQPINQYTESDFLNWLSSIDTRMERCKVPADYMYSNASVGLLGPILTNANPNKLSWEQLIADRITIPLGMTQTSMSSNGVVQGYLPNGQPANPWPIFAWYAAGALRSTAADMLSFGEAAIGHTTVAGRPVPTPLSMGFRVAEKSIYRRDPKDYRNLVGMSWDMQQLPNIYWAIHKNGGTDGFSSVLVINHQADCAIFIVGNRGGTNVTDAGVGLMGLIMISQGMIPGNPFRPG
jgi:CubicO group peptidase (beta-lactamase class C family)